MRYVSRSHLVSIGLAIFSMLFGAGNLIYPIMVGMTSGHNITFGLIGFLLTSVCLPIAGLIAMILFEGNYVEFFNRLGRWPGRTALFICMAGIGPLVAIPRTVTLSHIMVAPYLPNSLQSLDYYSSFIFALIFLTITFVITFRENRIIHILGYFISPLLIFSLLIILLTGLFEAEYVVPTSLSPYCSFATNLVRGYETLDLLACIFFSSIVIHILKNTLGNKISYSHNALALIGFKAGTIGVALLGVVYIGLSLLGMFYGHNLEHANAGEIFQIISYKILGKHGGLLIGTAVLMACVSTAIALSAVFAEYIQYTLSRNRIGYVPALIITLLLCLPLSTFGLGKVLWITAGPIVYIGYPMLITLTICNIAYKLFGFKWVRLPVFLTLVVALVSYLH